MDPDTYFNYLNSTTQIVEPLMQKKLDNFLEKKLSFSDNPSREQILNLPNKRLGNRKPKSRIAFFRLIYELCGGENWEDFKGVAGAIEMNNIGTYSFNYGLDGKGENKSLEYRFNMIKASDVQTAIAYQLLISSLSNPKISKEQSENILLAFSEINLFTNGIGQYRDSDTLKTTEGNYLNKYKLRCEGLTGHHYKNIARIAFFLSANTDLNILKSLSEIGLRLGTIIQTVNDLKDFIPPSKGVQSDFKVYQDQFNDLRQGTITLPIYFLQRKKDSTVQQAIEKIRGNSSADNLETEAQIIFSAIKKYNIPQEIKSFLSPIYNAAISELNQFKKNIIKSEESQANFKFKESQIYLPYKILKTMLTTNFRSNRIYSAFKET